MKTLNLNELRSELKNINSKNEKKNKLGVNAYFERAFKENKSLSKEDLINEVVLLMFKDKFNEELNIENLKKRAKEVEELSKTINNSIDTSKSNTSTKGYISGTLKNQRLLKNAKDEYYFEIIK